MPRCLFRLSLAFAVLLSSEAWAIGLGDIRLDSALNEPLRAEIELLSATPEELAALQVSLAPREIFDRYGIDRPAYLQTITFRVAGSASGGAVIRLGTPGPITEPFLTFLVEASWPSGRLLREYTVLLDPPTYAPPAVQQAPAVTAPTVSEPADSGRIERQPAPVAAEPPRRPPPEPVSAPPEQRPVVDEPRYDQAGGGDYVVQRGDTLWGIAARVRPDDRLTMNQTMVAIYEANPGAFGGNINLLRARATLRIPSADEIYRISRGDALTEVQRQNTRWQTGAPGDFEPPAETRPSLVLVPPDEVEEAPVVGVEEDVQPAETLTREEEIEKRIAELEGADVPEQRSLIEIRDNELAALRQELANIRGEVYEPPVSDVSESPFVEEAPEEAEVVEPAEVPVAGDTAEAPAEDVAAPAEEAKPDATTTVARTPRVSEPGIVERTLDAVRSFWPALLGGLVIIGGLLFWRGRRGREAVSETPPWQPLDSEEAGGEGEFVATKTIPAPSRDDDSIMVIEEDTGIRPIEEPTAEMPILSDAEEVGGDTLVSIDDTTSGAFGSIEDTFSSDTAVNLDQTDPIAEADFHMAYGLYDQAADLINGALETDPEDSGLLAKLCEVYFVWGQREPFINAAGRLKAALGDGAAGEWDKTVIMGQQIAADDELFADAGLTAATQAVDMSFDADADSGSELDIDFGAQSDSGTDIIDLGGEDDIGDSNVIDFGFDEADEDIDLPIEPTNEMETLEIPAADSEKTVETPTVEMPLDDDEGGTAELPSIEALPDDEASTTDVAATAEINLDDLGLDIDDLADADLASLEDFEDLGDDVDTGRHGDLDLEAMIQPDDTGEMRLAKDDTGVTPGLYTEDEETDVDIDLDLLDATGMTQVLDEGVDDGELLGDDDATVQSPAATGEFDFARTEALPSEAFSAMDDLEETGEMPAIAETDLDLDLDDLTAALKVTEVPDPEDLAEEDTVEQPRPSSVDAGQTAEIPTMELAPDDLPDELKEARTMTEVGTKLDLARAYVDMGDPGGARSILEEVLEEGDESQRQQAQQLLDTLSD